jgi:hypothetical protein
MKLRIKSNSLRLRMSRKRRPFVEVDAECAGAIPLRRGSVLDGLFVAHIVAPESAFVYTASLRQRPGQGPQHRCTNERNKAAPSPGGACSSTKHG